MEREQWIKDLFGVIDSMDTAAFTSFLTENVHFRFGNMPAIDGREEVGKSISGFYESIKGLSHQIDNYWHTGDVLVCNGTVTYTRHDSTKLSVPFANIFKMKGDLVGEYLIYADISNLYQ